MKNVLVPMSAVLVLGAGAAFAQDTGFQGGGINLEYNSLNNDNLDSPISMWSANFGVAYNVAPQFGLQVGAGYNSISTEFDAGDIIELSLDMTDLNAHAYYNYGTDNKFGVFAARYSVSNLSIAENGVFAGALPLSMDLMTYGVEGMYNSGPVKVEARYGMAEIQNSLILGPIAEEIDISFYELDAEYAVSSKFNLVGGINGTTAAIGSDEITLNTYSVGVEYMVMANLGLTASVDGGSLSITGVPESIDLLGYSVGAEYVVAGSSDITLFASYGTSNISGLGIDEDTTNLKVGANIAFGGSNSSDLFSRISLF